MQNRDPGLYQSSDAARLQEEMDNMSPAEFLSHIEFNLSERNKWAQAFRVRGRSVDEARQAIYFYRLHIDRIYRLLGCVVEKAEDGIFKMEHDGYPPPHLNEAVRRGAALLFSDYKLGITTNISDFSFYTGIGSENKWEDCLRDPCDPHLFASKLIRIVKWSQSTDARMAISSQKLLLPILNNWCKPDSTWEELPPIKVICEKLFGPAWWEIYRPDLAEEIDIDDPMPEGDWESWDFHYFSCDSLILETRPPFLPERLPELTPEFNLSIPEL